MLHTPPELVHDKEISRELGLVLSPKEGGALAMAPEVAVTAPRRRPRDLTVLRYGLYDTAIVVTQGSA
jgi:hypothetical protein